MSNNAIRAALRRVGIGKKATTGHVFRAMSRTLLVGLRPDFIEHQLAYGVRDPNGRAYYSTVYLPEQKNDAGVCRFSEPVEDRGANHAGQSKFLCLRWRPF